MPNHFDNISNKNELFESLLCTMCEAWPIKPLICNKCESMFCQSCIKLETEHKLSLICPNCPNEAKSPLSNPIKQILKIVNTASFACNFCKQIKTYNNIIQHSTYCEQNPFRKVKCEKCQNEVQFDKLNTHDCIQELLRDIKETNEKLIEDNKRINFTYDDYTIMKYKLRYILLIKIPRSSFTKSQNESHLDL
jgi:hypothetical protein